MSKRTIWILAGLLVVQLGLGVITRWPAKTADAAEPLLAGITADQVVGLVVSDSQGNRVHLARQDDGAWVLPDADDYPADAAQVTEAIDSLLALTKSSAVTETAASHDRLQLGDSNFVRRAELEVSDGALWAVLIGSSPSYSDSYVRLEGEDVAYLGKGLSSWEWGSTAAGWVEDTLYLSVSEEDVSTVAISNSLGELTLVHLDDGTWSLADQPADSTLDETAVTTLVQRATALRFAQPLGREALPEYGLDEPLLTMTVTTADNTLELVLGSELANGSYVAKSSASDYYVSLSAYTAQALLEASTDSLQQIEEVTLPDSSESE